MWLALGIRRETKQLGGGEVGKIQRYEFNYNGLVEPDEDGAWCSSDDVKQLEQQNAKLEEEVNKLNDENEVNFFKWRDKNARQVEYGEQLFLNLESVRSHRKYAVKECKKIRQQNAKLIECLESLLECGNTGEDAKEIKLLAQQALSEVTK